VRKDFFEIIKFLKNESGIKKVAITTNGYHLDEKAKMLVDSGLDSINISIDSLDRNIFNYFKSANSAYAEDATVFHELFPISPYSAAIPDPALRAKFNATLRLFIEDGRYQLLLDEYKLDNLLHKLPVAETAK